MDIDRVDALREGYRIFTSTSFQAASGEAFQELQFDTSPQGGAPAQAAPVKRSGKAGNSRNLPPKVVTRSARASAALVASSPTSNFRAAAIVPASNNRHTAVPESYLDPTVSAAAKVLFSPQGNFVQELVLEEAVNIADALSRSIVSSAIASVTKNPVAMGSLLVRNALVGGTAAMLPPVLKPVSSGLRRMRPFYPFSIAVQELEGVFHLREEDIESLRTLKRLVQMLAGVDPTLHMEPKDGLVVPIEGSAGSGKLESTGLIEAEDLALVQQVLVQFSSQIRPGQWPAQALKIVPGMNRNGEPSNIRARMRQILPLIRDSVPGATTLAIRFGRRLVGRSLGRMAERIEGVNRKFLLVEEEGDGDGNVAIGSEPTGGVQSSVGSASAAPPKNPFAKPTTPRHDPFRKR